MRRRSRSRLRSFGRVFLVALVIALAFPLVTAERTQDLVPPIGVRVKNQVQFVPPGTTFGAIVRQFSLQAHDGALHDVDGGVLDAAKYPGAILLNGSPGRPTDVLHDHDVVKVVNGEDRTEGTVRTVEEVPGGMTPNPEFYLGTTPGETIVVKGRISGRLVSSTFHATGPSQTPNAVALTFDDGPSPLYTPQILQILQQFGVQATFFCIGFEARDHPDLIVAERDAGMTVGNHSWDHPEVPPFRDLPESKIRSEMTEATAALQASGVDPYVFRPPGGTYGDTELRIASELGMRVVLWSVDPEDWRNDAKAKQIVKNVLSNVHAGSIVILHDGGGFQDATVKALPKIIKGIQDKGLSIVPLLR
jgi:peptidoglycan/xylan/chitin deacetylase (PgdA/CDA1 family)